MSDAFVDGEFELVTLRNGARAVRHVGNGEIMHPSVGPWREANALYVEQSRLAERLTQPGRVVLFDVGLGAATNAVAALACAQALGPARKASLEVVSFEVDLAPLRLGLADAQGFDYLVPFRPACEALLASNRWEGAGLTWALHRGDLRDTLPKADARADVVFFDPFSPESNPTLWTPEFFAAVRARCSDDATLFTYSASTSTRASMLLGGFFVGVGAAIGTKKETTTAATRPALLAQPLDGRWLQRWERSSAKAPHGVGLTPEVEQRIRAHPQFASGAR